MSERDRKAVISGLQPLRNIYAEIITKMDAKSVQAFYKALRPEIEVKSARTDVARLIPRKDGLFLTISAREPAKMMAHLNSYFRLTKAAMETLEEVR